MKSGPTTVSQYLDELPEERRAAWAKLRKLRPCKAPPSWGTGRRDPTKNWPL